MSSLSTFVNDNHLDNYLKEILAFVYLGLLINIQPNKIIFFPCDILSSPYISKKK